MGGEVIIITSDPDVTTPVDPNQVNAPKAKQKVSVSQIGFKFSDDATPRQIADAVYSVLESAKRLV